MPGLLWDWLVQSLQCHPKLVSPWSCSGPTVSLTKAGPMRDQGVKLGTTYE